MPTVTRQKAQSSAADSVPFTKDAKEQLRRAIKTVSEERLREIVTELASKEPIVEKELMKTLVVSGNKRKIGIGATDLLSRWETCANCAKEFDVGEERKGKECHYHSGNLEPDYNAFGDDDEDPNTEWYRKEYPENFNWSCCGEDGTTEGCVASTHEAGGMQKKRKL
ncbi:hypothetical protein CALVIDRAFT_536362 [Calocera viscosa TUFC12733]|uniref:C2H2-type domain-containing protein n=1 Tax=Calocera viscosa (strain TUFC12733) TaxID=1330018 RepID=A0A167N4Q0_CALVF|nr:hypothetical protein CALVIDRAFT_536362 [Calocera viscosa TUFC12733]